MARQHPTLQHVWIRTTQDAFRVGTTCTPVDYSFHSSSSAAQVFYGVARGILRKVDRRLDTDERRSILAGNIYVWEERGANLDSTGLSMERW